MRRAVEGSTPKARHRAYSIAFKHQVVQQCPAGETLEGLPHSYDLSRTMIWVDKYEAGAFDEDAEPASMIQKYGTRMVALERVFLQRPAQDLPGDGLALAVWVNG